jgi:1,4-dihydroxy-2-naphthoate octaprenyltransferase
MQTSTLAAGLPIHSSFWVTAVRPRTLSLSMTPVTVGTALAWTTENRIHWLPALAALVGSVLIQIGTNLHNDVADSARGGDGPDRVGPPVSRQVAS